MRLTETEIDAIRCATDELAGNAARVWLFGSRVSDDARGGDVDLLLELSEPVAEPARLSAQLAARVSPAMYGRKVDVLIEPRFPVRTRDGRESGFKSVFG